jgi:hypothetical protein
MRYRLEALVEWMDFVHETLEQFDYKGRSDVYVARRLMMPLSAKPVEERHASALVAHAQTWHVSHHDALRAFIAQYDDDPRRPFVGVDAYGVDRDAVQLAQRTLSDAGVVLAVVRGDALRILQTMDGALGGVNPPWSTSRFSASELRYDGRFVRRGYRTKAEEAFVWDAEGCVMGTVHRRLVEAGCRFDHWRSHDVFHSGARIDVGVRDPPDASFHARDWNDSDGIVVTVGRRSCLLDVGATRWWDRTYGAVVLPVIVQDSEQRALLVIPGVPGLHRDESPFASAADACAHESGVKDDVAPLIAHFMNHRPFLVALDPAGVPSGMPMQWPPPPSTTAAPGGRCGCEVVDDRLDTWATTEQLACLFIAYAYAGSICGTRIMPFLAARAHAEDGNAAGRRLVEAVRLVLFHAPCPMGFYAFAALRFSHVDRTQLAQHLRCDDEHRLYHELAAKMRASHRHGFWVRYDASEWQRQRKVEWERQRDARMASARNRDLSPLATPRPPPSDEWQVALEARTGAEVRDDQRAKVDGLLGRRMCVAQMHMGFGKSSVVVPLLVAAYLQRPAIRAVFVTQPEHLTPAAARILGALVASHPVVADGRSDALLHDHETLVYVLGADDFRRHVALYDDHMSRLVANDTPPYKLVVVLSTSAMQCLVRDFPRLFYEHRHALAHIADEVDGESDPLTCEVIIQGRETQAHPNPRVAEQMPLYYDAVYSLVRSKGDVHVVEEKIAKLNALSRAPTVGGRPRHAPHHAPKRHSPKRRAAQRGGHASSTDVPHAGEVLVGDRLVAVYRHLRDVKLQVKFGLAGDDDHATHIAVPYDYADVPSKNRFVDIEVASVLTARAVFEADALRPTDERLVEHELRTKLGAEIRLTDAIKREYLATVLAMPQLRVSATERMVSFVDLLGAAGTFVGFSGTMGTRLRAPTYAAGDPRRNDDGDPGEIAVVADASKTRDIERRMRASPIFPVYGDKGDDATRSRAVVAELGRRVREMKHGASPSCVCIVDACGELGVLPNARELLGAALGETDPIGHFDSNGALQNPQSCVRYYSHRDSRGVDSQMPVGTVGFTIVALETTTFNDAAQAIYRMRRIDRGEHTPHFVVVHNESPRMAVSGADLVTRLKANEVRNAEAARPLQEMQRTHAARRKASSADFERTVVYAPVVWSDESSHLPLSTAEQQQEQTKENVAERTVQRYHGRLCYRHGESYYFPDCIWYNDDLVENRAFLQSLDALGLWMSALFRCETRTPTATRRRAFAISNDLRCRIIIMTIAEVWASNPTYPNPNWNRNEFGHTENAIFHNDHFDPATSLLFTHDGKPLNDLARATHHPTDLNRLGRFLCDDRMSLADEVALLRYLKDKPVDPLLAVCKCLYESEFLSPTNTLLLHRIGVQQQTPQALYDELKGFLRNETHPLPDVLEATDQIAQLTKDIVEDAMFLFPNYSPYMGGHLVPTTSVT